MNVASEIKPLSFILANCKKVLCAHHLLHFMVMDIKKEQKQNTEHPVA